MVNGLENFITFVIIRLYWYIGGKNVNDIILNFSKVILTIRPTTVLGYFYL